MPVTLGGRASTPASTGPRKLPRSSSVRSVLRLRLMPVRADRTSIGAAFIKRRPAPRPSACSGQDPRSRRWRPPEEAAWPAGPAACPAVSLLAHRRAAQSVTVMARSDSRRTRTRWFATRHGRLVICRLFLHGELRTSHGPVSLRTGLLFFTPVNLMNYPGTRAPDLHSPTRGPLYVQGDHCQSGRPPGVRWPRWPAASRIQSLEGFLGVLLPCPPPCR